MCLLTLIWGKKWFLKRTSPVSQFQTPQKVAQHILNYVHTKAAFLSPFLAESCFNELSPIPIVLISSKCKFS